MAKFCGKCGARLDEATGLCPNCAPAQAIQEESKKEELKKEEPKKVEPEKTETKKEKPKKTKKEKKARKPLSKKAKLWLIISTVVIVAALVAGALFLLRDDGGYEVPRVDVDEYFEENTMILDIIDAKRSTDVLTEAEAYTILTERGFDQFPVTTSYTMDGEYVKEMEISETSNTKHPIYQTYYINSEGDVWRIVIINGAIMADPVSFNQESGRTVPIGLSETEDMMSYDAKENKFFHTIPNTTVLTVITVGRIDAMALEELTKGALDEL